MSDIPADIRIAAEGVVERGYDEGLIDAVCRALMAERERCAVLVQEFVTQQNIVDEIEYHVNSEHGGDATIDHFVPVIARYFATAIRRGTPHA